jgi:hypothetical protein
MQNKSETLSKIYNICFDSENKSDNEDCCNNLIELLQNNYNHHDNIDNIIVKNCSSFLSCCNTHNYYPDSSQDISIKQVISDGHKLYHQFLDNNNTTNHINEFIMLNKFDNYIENIPKEKYIKTRNGFEYNIDDLISIIQRNKTNIEPFDINSTLTVWSNINEENSIIAHPGLSTEIRTMYLDEKNKLYEDENQLSNIIIQNINVLDNIGKYGIILLNIELSHDYVENLLQNFTNDLNTIGELLYNYQIFPNKSVNQIILQDFLNNYKRTGYYIVLLYFKLYILINKSQKHPILPFFMSFDTVNNLYIGTVTVPQINVAKPNQTFRIFIYCSELQPNKLLITNQMINSDKSLDTSNSGIDLFNTFPELENNIDDFMSLNFSKQYLELFNSFDTKSK